MTALRHALGLFILLLATGLGYLSKWLIGAGAWLVDREALFIGLDTEIEKVVKKYAEDNPEK